jgi:hypothetical protein
MSGITMGTPAPLERHWFVAINDMDVGPMDVTEVEARWRAGEIHGASLVWRPGFPTWAPLADVAELQHFVALQEIVPTSASFPEVRWEASEAASLSALVAHELQAAELKTQSQPTSSFVDDGSLSGLPDITSLGFQKRSAWDDAWSAPLPVGLGGGFQPATVPWENPRGEYKKRLQLAVLIGAGFMVLATGLILAVAELLQPRVVQPVATMAELPALAAVTPAAEPALKPVLPATTADEEPALAPAPAPAPVAKPAPRAVTKKPPRPRSPASDSSAAEGRALSREDILAGIRKNAPSLMPCLKAARSNGEIEPGQLRLVLEWNVDADGSVSGGRLKGPPKAVQSSLRTCFAAKMREWQFPASSRTSSVRNFVLPVNVR